MVTPDLAREAVDGVASMGSGRGDRNQTVNLPAGIDLAADMLQWGPVVVTGIR